MVLRVQEWQPDTHDGYVFHVRWSADDVTGEDDGSPHVAVAAWLFGEPQDDPQGLYARIHDVEHVNKNLAVAAVEAALPDDMKKMLTDADGDPLIDFVAAKILMEVKAKHRPRWSLSEKGEVLISVPGAGADLVKALDAAVPMAAVIAHEG